MVVFSIVFLPYKYHHYIILIMNILTFLSKNKMNNPLFIQAVFLIVLVIMGSANPMAVVFAYVFETIIIGFVHILKLFYICLR